MNKILDFGKEKIGYCFLDQILLMGELKLYMLLLGCRPNGRLTEQHDVYFGIAKNLKALIPHIKNFWPEAKGNIHIDAWREVTRVNDHSITIIDR